jgi:sugar (pentulose or hexulose) kinase
MAGNSHGHTLAAWTGVTISFVGFCISGICTVLAQPIGFVAGLVVAVGGGVVGLLMKAAGLGQPKASGTSGTSGTSGGARAQGRPQEQSS